jgi:short-subunit dehydrogenase
MTRYPGIDLVGAIVAITGGARGIGAATAEAFARRGARVHVGDLDGPVHLDVASRASFDAFIKSAPGPIDVLVNNAGVMPLGAFLDEDDAISATTLNVNVWGLINGMRAVAPGMIARGQGHIVNVASMAGKIAIPGMAVYNASKFAAVGLSGSVRAELEPGGVSVTAVLPSAVRTDLASGAPLGHGMPTVDPSEVADAIVDSVRHRRAEVTVPRFLAGWDAFEALTPGPVLRLGRRMLGDRRALTSVDHDARAAYEKRIADQAHRVTP